ncbi:hypothetical protein TYRP_020479 [Tyrophagus putrescentiae]|nr:hypothetical protein TYRP_020479 [Tyrophagus putrescentiae]
MVTVLADSRPPRLCTQFGGGGADESPHPFLIHSFVNLWYGTLLSSQLLMTSIHDCIISTQQQQQLTD